MRYDKCAGIFFAIDSVYSIQFTLYPYTMKQSILSTLACFVLLCLVSSVSARAQGEVESAAPTFGDSFTPEFRVGVSAGLTKNFHKDMGLRVIDDPSCPVFNSIDSTWGRSVGLVFVYQHSAISGITAHLLHSIRPGVGTSRLPSAQVILPSFDPNVDPQVVEQSVSARTDVRYDLYEFGLMGTLELISTKPVGLGVAFGGAIAHVDVLTATVEQEMTAPENARFINLENWPTRNEGRVIVFAENEPIQDAASTRLSVRAGAFMDVRPWGPLHITPGLYYDYGLTTVTKDSDWTVNSILLQLDLTIAL